MTEKSRDNPIIQGVDPPIIRGKTAHLDLAAARAAAGLHDDSPLQNMFRCVFFYVSFWSLYLLLSLFCITVN